MTAFTCLKGSLKWFDEESSNSKFFKEVYTWKEIMTLDSNLC